MIGLDFLFNHMKKFLQVFHTNIIAIICYLLVNISLMYGVILPFLISYPSNTLCILGLVLGILNTLHLGKYLITIMTRNFKF